MQLNESAMAFQADRNDSLQGLRSPTLSVGETVHDLSNLCLVTTPASLNDETEVVRSSRWTGTHDDRSPWYPSEKELEESTSEEICIERLLEQSELKDRKQSPRRSRSLSPSTLCRRYPGAFHSSYPQLDVKPAPPAWVETAQELSEKAQRQGLLSRGKSEAIRADSPLSHYIEVPSVQSSCGGSRFEENSLDEQPGPTYNMGHYNDAENLNDLHSPPSSTENPSKQIEIEVAPGLYMPLRGSDETIDAIESGRACIVRCFACNSKLSCVPDCELVICPDCRVLSPVQDEDEDLHRSMPNMGSGNWSDDDQTPGYNMSSASLPPPRRGVGLGLKMRC